MKAILVDDEKWGLEALDSECKGIKDVEIIGEFRNPLEALEFAQDHRIDLALLDIEMPKMSGLDLSDGLRELYPDIIVIFVSAYDQYYRDAFKNRKADYFLLKPYSAEEVQEVLDRAKLLSARQRKKVVIKTFGDFRVYVDEEPLKFSSPRAEELLAILVDAAGEPVTTEEAFSMMWETIPYNHTEAGRYRKALQKLQNTLIDAGIENILSYFPHARAIRKDMVDCDYFDLLAEDPETMRNWNASYMNQYSWAEPRNGMILRTVLKHYPDIEQELFDKRLS